MKVTIVMCEGPHDVAFLSRIMHADGYHTYGAVINQYPPFVAQFLKGHITRGSLEDLNLKEARGGLFLPSFALEKGSNLLLLYNLKGDSKKEGRKTIITSFDVLFRNTGTGLANILQPGDALTIAYIYDADQKGVDARIGEVNKELEEFINPGRDMAVKHGTYDSVQGIKYGAYIFHASDDANNVGRLEDLILPLMKQTAHDIHCDVQAIVEKRRDRHYDLFKSESKAKDKDFDEQKSTIGMMGQLQKSGSPNAAIIEQSHFIDNQQILSDAICREIISFVNDSFV